MIGVTNGSMIVVTTSSKNGFTKSSKYMVSNRSKIEGLLIA